MQNLYRPNISFPYVEHTNISYLTNGIRLANVYYDNDGLKYGKNGRYYVSVVAPIDTLIKQYTIKISAYRVVNGQTVTVLSTSKVLDCENLPVVKLSYRGESSSEVQDIYIPKGTRIAQFRIQLSQKATAWQKIKWLFSSKPKLIRVASLANEERGGFGSTGN